MWRLIAGAVFGFLVGRAWPHTRTTNRGKKLEEIESSGSGEMGTTMPRVNLQVRCNVGIGTPPQAHHKEEG